MPTLKRKPTRLCDYFPTIHRPPADYFATILRLFETTILDRLESVGLVYPGAGWCSWSGVGLVSWSVTPSLPGFQLLQPSSVSSVSSLPGLPTCLLFYKYYINAFKIKIKGIFKVLRLTLYIYIALIKTLKKRLKIAL